MDSQFGGQGLNADYVERPGADVAGKLTWKARFISMLVYT